VAGSEEIEGTREFIEAEARLRYQERVQQRALEKEERQRRDNARDPRDLAIEVNDRLDRR
jgi:hypothetical protein